MWKLDTLLQAFGGLVRYKDSKLAKAGSAAWYLKQMSN